MVWRTGALAVEGFNAACCLAPALSVSLLLSVALAASGCSALGDAPSPLAAQSAGSTNEPAAAGNPSPPSGAALPVSPASGDVSLTTLDDALFARLQAFRAEQGKPALGRNPLLDRAAQSLADVMARKNTLSHSADGQRAGERIEDAGYTTCTNGAPWAENIARSSVFGEADDVVEIMMTGWINSPGHRQNMVGAFAEAGLAVAVTQDQSRVYAAQVFATPGPGGCL